MKTKLSFFALPFCLGLVLSFVLACGDSGGDEPATSSPSNARSSSSAPPDVTVDGVEFGDFTNSYVDGSKYYIIGSILATGGKDARIRWLKFTTSAGAVMYNNSKASADYMQTNAGTIQLSGLNSYIDLEDASIECKEQSVTIYACADEEKKTCGNKTYKYTKPSSLCVASSSSGTLSSSSEEKKWKFEASKQVTVPKIDETVSLDDNSVAFKLTGDEGTPALEITSSGGKVRPATLCGTDDEPVPGKTYESFGTNSDCLGDEIPSESSVDVSFLEFYMIYSGNKRYLVQFTRENRDKTWPRICTYWKATEFPK